MNIVIFFRDTCSIESSVVDGKLGIDSSFVSFKFINVDKFNPSKFIDKHKPDYVLATQEIKNQYNLDSAIPYVCNKHLLAEQLFSFLKSIYKPVTRYIINNYGHTISKVSDIEFMYHTKQYKHIKLYETQEAALDDLKLKIENEIESNKKSVLYHESQIKSLIKARENLL